MIPIFFISQLIVSLVLIVLILFAFIYSVMPFVEERVSIVKHFARALNIFNFAMGFLLFFTEYGKSVALITIVTNLAWLSVLYHGFPFISLTSIDFILGLIGTLGLHCWWMVIFLETDVSGSFALFLYIAVIWAMPLVCLISLISTDESLGEDNKSRPKSFWASFIEKKLQWVKSMLPHTGDKLD
ncbi:hypothetical protein TRFO_35656 [Tritrichomonas foetus]|uniref:Transmembrane adaptor Erv26 n=1 Tax=Tritrichomonas foetus TaxID=1144522 RepID=A0A1J4JFW4_9EUKA|nr:hypothetical protein TRFO_35656 [Tritrichomonas foetus]|eukprot:OHS98016.1 hypothetical protein TRFO_35656 [Tritrichomonas foetus]